MRQKIMAGLLSMCLLTGMLPTSILADNEMAKNKAVVCTHHPEHTEECGYAICDHKHTEECYQMVKDCVHEHKDSCYGEAIDKESGKTERPDRDEVETASPAVATVKRDVTILKKSLSKATPSVATPPNSNKDDAANCKHICSEASGCIVRKAVCVHAEGIHDETCNYEEGKVFSECKFVCPICPIQERINALPGIDDLEELSEEEQMKLYEELKSILAAMEALKPEERAQLDTARLDALMAMIPSVMALNLGDVVQGLSPANVTVNLFDYWASERNLPDDEASAKGRNETYDNYINKDHVLRFNPGGDYISINKDFNKYTGKDKGPYTGIVAKRLSDGYPELDLTEEKVEAVFGSNSGLDKNESLDYLFNSTEGEGKAAYENVKGLFQIDPTTGNYYYDSKKNFAEFNETENAFILYGAPGVSPGGVANQDMGQFFPFNSGADAALVCTDSTINHYFGVTMEAEFQQPENGQVSNFQDGKDMVFEFSGDDDIWIFIDDVLVADMGGIHDSAEAKINFADGTVEVEGVDDTTLKDIYVNAGATNITSFTNNTFATGTQHTLKVFYLERGNGASNLKMNFNLMETRSNQIVKVDQDGRGMNGVEFELYGENDNKLAHLTTGSDGLGLADLVDDKNTPIQFEVGKNYWLREVKTTDGFVTTGDIELTYESSGQLKVVNQWETGAVAGFEAQIEQTGELKDIQGDDVSEEAKEGLIVAVPFFKTDKDAGAAESWRPMYGSVTEGFRLVHAVEENSALLQAALETALRQIANPDYEHWHLDWDESRQAFRGVLIDLPGSADRYSTVNADGDLQAVYYLLEYDDFTEEMDTEAKHEILANQITDDASIEEFVQNHIDNFRLLDIKDFNRQFYTRLYIPNQVRELRVLKQDASGNSLQGAEFGLYTNKECTDLVAKGITGDGGMLTFSAQNSGNNAVNGGDLSSNVRYALSRLTSQNGRENRSYWLKEISAPAGYQVNGTAVEVRITADSIYANAGSEDDGVSVRKGAGKLLQTVARYAASEDINVTLRDITASKYVQDKDLEGTNLPEFTEWTSTNDEAPLSLHYGLSSKMLDYGLHDDAVAAGRLPYFTAETGWVGFGVTQNYDAHQNEGARKEDIRLKDISALLTGTTTVVVKDEAEPPEITEGSLKVTKTVVGKDATTDTFNFTVTLTGTDQTPINGTYGGVIFTGGVGSFTLGDGGEKVLSNIPVGTSYEVEEADYSAVGYTATVTGSETGTITANAANVTVAYTNTWTDPTPEPTGTLTITKIVEGKDDKTDMFEFTVTLTDVDQNMVNETYGDVIFTNGTAKFTLKHGDSKTISGIPVGTSYKVEEADYSADGYTATVIGSATGTITANAADVTVAYTNTWTDPTPEPKTGTLTVTKTVAGEQGETDREFHFTVTLRDAASTGLNGEFGGLTFTNGTAEFTLKHGGSQEIAGIPEGTSYEVAEDDYSADGYITTTSGNEAGTIAADAAIRVTFTNTKEKQDPGPGPDPEPKKGDLTVSKIVAGNDGEKEREFHFTVILNEKDINGVYGDLEFANGIARFTLKDGDSKTASGLPVGTAYKVEETEANQDGYTTGAVGDSGTIIEGEKTASFTNTREKQDPGPGPDPEPRTGNLTVSKTVSGSRGDKSKEFTFTVTLGDISVTGDFGAMHFAEGAAVFKLKHGDSVTASGLPADVRYTVSESDNAGYTVTASGEEGVIEAGKTAMALFNNYRGGGGSSGGPSDPGDRGPGGENPTVPEVTLPEHPGDQGGEQPGGEPIIPYVELDRVPKTGDTTNLSLWLWLLGLSSAGVLTAFGFYMRRRKSDRE